MSLSMSFFSFSVSWTFLFVCLWTLDPCSQTHGSNHIVTKKAKTALEEHKIIAMLQRVLNSQFSHSSSGRGQIAKGSSVPRAVRNQPL